MIIEGYGASGLRSTFGETGTRTLGDMTGDILAAFIARAALMKDNRRKAEIAQREAEAVIWVGRNSSIGTLGLLAIS